MPSKNHSISIEEMEGRAGVERSEPGGRAQLNAGARGRSAGGRRAERELRQELVDDAVDRVRSGRAGGELPEEVREQLTDGLIDELLAGARTQEEIVGPGGLLGDLTRRLVERAMAAELTEHLGYEPHAEPPGGTGNTRNGSTPKALQTEHGPVRIERPRDRRGTFEPQIVKNGQRRFEGFDDKIIALYACGMPTRAIPSMTSRARPLRRLLAASQSSRRVHRPESRCYGCGRCRHGRSAMTPTSSTSASAHGRPRRRLRPMRARQALERYAPGCAARSVSRRCRRQPISSAGTRTSSAATRSAARYTSRRGSSLVPVRAPPCRICG